MQEDSKVCTPALKAANILYTSCSHVRPSSRAICTGNDSTSSQLGIIFLSKLLHHQKHGPSKHAGGVEKKRRRAAKLTANVQAFIKYACNTHQQRKINFDILPSFLPGSLAGQPLYVQRMKLLLLTATQQWCPFCSCHSHSSLLTIFSVVPRTFHLTRKSNIKECTLVSSHPPVISSITRNSGCCAVALNK